jgi:uncharacterized protein (DUF302 family)
MPRRLVRTVRVDLPLGEIHSRLRSAVENHNLVLSAVHDLKEPLRASGPYVKGEFYAFEIGYVGPIRELAGAFPAILSLLPGRICAWSEGGATGLSYISPVAIAQNAPIPARHRKLVVATCRDFERRLSGLIEDLSRIPAARS